SYLGPPRAAIRCQIDTPVRDDRRAIFRSSPVLASAVLSIAAGDASDTRTTLVAVILLLGAVLVGLVALLVALRRRTQADDHEESVPVPTPMPRPIPRMAAPPARPARRRPPTAPSSGGELAVASSSTQTSGMVCPT